MRKMRWVVGDRVVIGFDMEDKKFRLARTLENGWKLSRARTSKGAPDTKGQMKTSVVKITLNSFPEHVSNTLKSYLGTRKTHVTNEYTIDSDGVIFDMRGTKQED